MKNVKTNSKFIIYILLIAIITAIIISRTFARYTQSKADTGTSQIAKWSFSANGLDNATLTRADITQGSILGDKIAPGTEGNFSVGVDARNCEVAIKYIVEISNIQNQPDNLYFYEDEACVTLMREKEENSGVYEINGIIEANATDENKQKNIEVYWKWEYETLATDDTTTEGDVIDTSIGKSGEPMSFDVRVIGTQYMGNALALQVNVGDKVNYNARTYSQENEDKITYTAKENVTGRAYNQVFTANEDEVENMEWKVLSKNEQTGVVRLVSQTSKGVSIIGKNGWWNVETVLNNISSVYGYGQGAIGAQSLSFEDVKNIAKSKGIVATQLGVEKEKEYTSGTFIFEDGREEVASESNPIKIKQFRFGFDINNDFFNSDVWLPFKGYFLHPNGYVEHIIHRINGERLYSYGIFLSTNTGTGPSYSVAPVVTLQPNIQTTGQVNGVWQLALD